MATIRPKVRAYRLLYDKTYDEAIEYVQEILEDDMFINGSEKRKRYWEEVMIEINIQHNSVQKLDTFRNPEQR